MLDFRHFQTITIVGGGTAGWFTALSLKKFFADKLKVRLIESPQVPLVGVGEGGLINLITTLNYLEIPTSHFMRETGASFKLGFCYESWRNAEKKDEFYHLFINPRHEPFNYRASGVFPLIGGLLANNVPMTLVVKDFQKILQRASAQDMVTALEQDSGLAPSLHFDSQRTADFLKKVALERDVEYVSAHVLDIHFDEQQHAKSIQTDQGEFSTDFLIDASGFSRLVIQKKLQAKWTSFKEYLWLDRAIPFHLDHQGQNPELVTRATAMKAGWMWQIPLRDRIGAGYVFSSEFTTEEQAIAEIEEYFGYKIHPQKTIHFEPGHFRQVWQKNVMAVGLASGFVEPLEATSIGQMLEQIRMFQQTIAETGGVVSDLSIERFNQANAESWRGIRDFLRMHYDCPRQDTPFWQKVAKTPYPESYAALKEVFIERIPRLADIQGYAMHGWNGIFHIVNWMFVAQGLGLISADACRAELQNLPEEHIVKINEYLASLKNKK